MHNPCPRLDIAVVVVINTGPWWVSILGAHTPQSSVIPLDHCNLPMWHASSVTTKLQSFTLSKWHKRLMNHSQYSTAMHNHACSTGMHSIGGHRCIPKIQQIVFSFRGAYMLNKVNKTICQCAAVCAAVGMALYG